MMGISNQDLVFKLKSIGVRVEGDDAGIDTDIIQAILQGKKLPHPREVILRDEPAAPTPVSDPARRRAPAPAAPQARRPAANPLRPNRPRTLIQKVEPRIQTLPASERPQPGFLSPEASIADVEMMEPVEPIEAPAPLHQEEARPVPVTPEPPHVEEPEPAPAMAAAATTPAPAPPATALPSTPVRPATAPPPPQRRDQSPLPPRRDQGPLGPGQRRDQGAPGGPGGQRRDQGGLPPRRDQGGPGAPRQAGPGGPGGPGPRRDGPGYPGQRPSGPGGPGGGPGGPGPRRDGPGYSAGGPGGPGPRRDGPGAGPGGPGPRRDGPSGPPLQRPGQRPLGPPQRRDSGPMRPGGGPSGPGGPGMGRPAGPSTPLTTEDLKRRAAERTQEQIGRDKKKKGIKKPGPHVLDEEDLAVFKGSISDLDEEEDVALNGASRRGRRAQQRKEEVGKLLTFKGKGRPEGAVMIREGMTLREFADKLGVRAKDLMKALFDRGIMANINQVLEPHLAEQLAKDLGVEVMVVSFEEEVQLKEELAATTKGTDVVEVKAKTSRAPVVTIMGHVDHGKTSLLDAIRSSKVTESEFGGITQHIGAYHVDVNGRQVVFLDTPGHEAFTMMRARGARVTDIVVLVVAADDGVMPQTVEAINHAKAARVPIVVAVNKMDKANANPDRVKRELSDQGLQPEDWGGDTVMVPISALRREGISELLDMILLTADVQELKASPEILGQGAVLEARKEVGRGIVATVLVQNGTLRVGDVFVSGAAWGRVRSMTDDRGQRIKEAGPSTPVEVTGFNDLLPNAGDLFQVVQDEAQARGIAAFRQQETRDREISSAAPGRNMSLAQLFSRIQEGEVKELAVVVKADVQGSLEVLRDALGKLSTEKVKVSVLHAGVGAISTNDVLLASASEALIVGFNVRPERTAVDLAEKEEVEIRLHTVIYELLDELRKAMTGLLDPTFREVASGRAEVRDTFKVPKIGTIAGCHVIEGVIPRSASVRLLRDNRVVYDGKIASLRRFKDDASEVRTGFDCGIGLERFQDFKPGDIIEAYVREEVAPVL